MTVGGVDTYYDYDEKQWKSRRLGGGPIRREPVVPVPRKPATEQLAAPRRAEHPKKHRATA